MNTISQRGLAPQLSAACSPPVPFQLEVAFLSGLVSFLAERGRDTNVFVRNGVYMNTKSEPNSALGRAKIDADVRLGQATERDRAALHAES